MVRRRRDLLLALLVGTLLLGALLPQLIPFNENPSISIEDQRVARRILEDPSVQEMIKFPFVLRVTLEDVQATSAQRKVFYFKGYTWFGILYVRYEVRSLDGRPIGGGTLP